MEIVNATKRKVLNFLDKKGYQLLRTCELEEKVDYYRKVLIESKIGKREEKIDSIVFSKDRAMQLHALLKSYIELVSCRGRMYVLYKTSSERHAKSYEDLQQIFADQDIVFVKEVDFRKQLIELCERSSAITIGLYVDDMIFVNRLDYSKLIRVDTLNEVVSLGRDKELNYSVVLQQDQKVPDFFSKENGFEYFKWDFTKEHSDWTFPLGVSGYFFGRDELVVMLNGIHFKAPNSLEINLQKYKPMFIHRFGVCMKKTCCVGVHANMVQSEFPNPVINTFSVEALLEKWEDGLMIELEKFYGVSGAIAQFQSYEFVKRS